MVGISYRAFVDPSGGSGQDSMTLAIGHRDRDGRGVLDAIRERRPPFSPEAVTDEFANLLKSYKVTEVVGDRFAGEWPRERLRLRGIIYEIAEHPKSQIYLEALPALNSGKVELLDHPRLAAQLCGLERRTARGGRDSIDHAPGAHDDVANAALGALLLVMTEPDTVELWLRAYGDPGALERWRAGRATEPAAPAPPPPPAPPPELVVPRRAGPLILPRAQLRT
jgi:hypothetical protein